MEAQRKKAQNKFKHRNRLNYRFLSSDPAADQYKRMTRDQISKLARKEKSCLIDLEGMEDDENDRHDQNSRYEKNSRYARHSPNETDTSPVWICHCK